jgi:Domain of unknown function DUF1828
MDCQELKNAVVHWFGTEFECRASSGESLIATLPILKPDGDPIEIGVEPIDKKRWKLSDLGDTHSTLYLADVDLYEEYVRAEEFRQIVGAHKITSSNEELSIETSTDEIAEALFDFTHAIQSMLALQFTVKPRTPERDFTSVVVKFFAEQHTSFDIPAEHVAGKTGRWKFNLVLNHVRQEMLVKTVSVTSRANALRLAEQNVFEIQDVREVRPEGLDFAVIADDAGAREQFWQPKVLRIFDGYNIPVFSFEKKRDALRQLALKYTVAP